MLKMQTTHLGKFALEDVDLVEEEDELGPPSSLSYTVVSKHIAPYFGCSHS